MYAHGCFRCSYCALFLCSSQANHAFHSLNDVLLRECSDFSVLPLWYLVMCHARSQQASSSTSSPSSSSSPMPCSCRHTLIDTHHLPSSPSMHSFFFLTHSDTLPFFSLPTLDSRFSCFFDTTTFSFSFSSCCHAYVQASSFPSSFAFSLPPVMQTRNVFFMSLFCFLPLHPNTHFSNMFFFPAFSSPDLIDWHMHVHAIHGWVDGIFSLPHTLPFFTNSDGVSFLPSPH